MPNADVASMKIYVSTKKGVMETCRLGHDFIKLPDHPKKDGLARCPYCMAIGLDKARKELAHWKSWRDRNPLHASK